MSASEMRARAGASAVAVAAALLALSVTGCGSTDNDAPGVAPPVSSAPYETVTEDPYTEDPATEDPYTEDPVDDDPYTDDDPYATESAAPDPFDSGTCLNGTLPDSTTAQEVDDVEEVDCSASDAHYQVIQTFPMTSDLSQCNSNSRTEYAFSYRYTLNGAAINEYVYCLVGLGSYARS
ncbi:LppU/SCO3897 family protein [Streptomyces flaveolus]|uniref:LppU/SCO3897 family protein n=1 Tax=Streptomyces flaveolus TaxID=67297 RepID=UPI0036FC7587